MKLKIHTLKTIFDFIIIFEKPFARIKQYYQKKDQEKVITLRNKQKLFINKYQDLSLIISIYKGEYLNPIKNPKTILDLGGYKGFSANWLQYKYPKAKIVILEANPKAIPTIKKNLKKNMVLIDKVILDKKTSIKFKSDKGGKAKISQKGDIIVGTITMNDLLKKYNQFDIIKIDIEGAESKVFNSISNKDWEKIGCVVGESHNNFPEYESVLRKHFDHISFNIRNKKNQTGLFKAWKTSRLIN